MKNVSSILWKKLNRLFGQPNGTIFAREKQCREGTWDLDSRGLRSVSGAIIY